MRREFLTAKQLQNQLVRIIVIKNNPEAQVNLAKYTCTFSPILKT